jgi:FMN-dependent NADH-azoreductase
MQLLHIDSAVTGEQSVSRLLTAQIVQAWKAAWCASSSRPTWW